MGVQCCPLPTAYLSTHTGGFEGNTCLDMSGQMAPVAAHWRREGVTFDAIYTGYMASPEQIALTADFIRSFRRPGCPVLVDPVMGDRGRAYRSYTPDMCRAMAELAGLADIITPNPTEAALLLDTPYEELEPEEARSRAEALSLNGRRTVVLTGVAAGPGRTGAVCWQDGRAALAAAPLVPGQFHGTGDLFASVLAGALVRGRDLIGAAELAAQFTSQCAAHTAEQPLPVREGLDFEPLLWRLGRRTEELYHGGADH